MNASQFLRDEHKIINGLLIQASAAFQRTPEMIPSIAQQLIMEMEIYFTLKKEFIYSHFERKVQVTSIKADQAILDILQQVKGLRERNVRAYVPYFDALTAEIRHYFDNEEHTVLPHLNSIAGSPMAGRKDALMKLPQYKESRPEVVQNPHGGDYRRKSEVA